jgi:hypothetical protein
MREKNAHEQYDPTSFKQVIWYLLHAHKTMLLSAKCNGKVIVTDRKQIIQKPCQRFDKNQ